MTLMMKRTHHVGARVDYFGVQVGADNPDLEQVEITFVEENGDSITTWYPRPGKGRLSGRWFDEELVQGKQVGRARQRRRAQPYRGVNET